MANPPPDRSRQQNPALPEPQHAIDQARQYGLRDGAFQAVTQGAGEQYLSAFALLLQANAFHLSILSALPQLIGTVAQLASVKVLRWFPDRKTLIQMGTIGQGLAWMPIILLPLLLPQWGPWLIIAGSALYFACAHFTSPTWNSFIADQLDQHERGSYFARRAHIMASLSFLSLGVAGGLLSLWQHDSSAWIGFAFVFAVAGLARLLSATALHRVCDLHHRPHHDGHASFRQFLAGTNRSFRSFLWFSGLLHFATLIAGPFFVIYMLRDLQLSYFEYGTWLAASILGQLMTLKAWGKFSDRFGNKALLSVTGLSVPFLPMLYLAGTHLAFLVCVNFLGGVVWAGLSLGLQNFIFDAVKQEDRPKAFAVTSTVNAIGWSFGALVGSWLIERLPGELRLAQLALPLASNLPLVFFVSGILRLAVSTSFLRGIHETRSVERVPPLKLLGEVPLVKTMAQFLAGPLSRLSK